MRKEIKAVIVETDIVTAYGYGVDICWNSILSQKSAISEVDRFCVDNFHSKLAATVDGVDMKSGHSLVMQMLKPLLSDKIDKIPRDTLLILSSTVGEIDYLEKAIDTGDDIATQSCLVVLKNRLEEILSLTNEAFVVSAACASATVAIAEASVLISNGTKDSILVVGCDAVSEFVYAGFSALMALDSVAARPFDKDRKGLTLGDGSGFLLLMSEERAKREGRTILGEIIGWGVSSDANHLTAPSRDGGGLKQAIFKALDCAKITSSNITSISAHGTGTIYNDAMEIAAFNSIFKGEVPAYSIKGGLGHTMGGAGLIEVALALKSLECDLVPPTVNLKNVEDEAKGWISSESFALKNELVLSTNSGFGGVNAALIIKGKL